MIILPAKCLRVYGMKNCLQGGLVRVRNVVNCGTHVWELWY